MVVAMIVAMIVVMVVPVPALLILSPRLWFVIPALVGGLVERFGLVVNAAHCDGDKASSSRDPHIVS